MVRESYLLVTVSNIGGNDSVICCQLRRLVLDLPPSGYSCCMHVTCRWKFLANNFLFISELLRNNREFNIVKGIHGISIVNINPLVTKM